jgi:glycosyltransferase involved in cell wall biosynthesis
MPKLSVILPVYNSEHYLKECIDSVLSQSFTDFEFLIFNDGSSDRSGDIIRSYNDKRIRFFDLKENSGYVHHLNEGIKLSRGEYLVRMDADDICRPDRFLVLNNFMDLHPKVGVCGSAVLLFGKTTKEWIFPSGNPELKAMLPFRVPFIHPSVIIRSKILKENNIFYDNDFLPAEDYEFWNRLAGFTEFANVKDILLKYRQHAGQISKRKTEIQQENSRKVRLKYFHDITGNDESFRVYERIASENYENSIDFFEKAISVFHKMYESRRYNALSDPQSIREELSLQLFKIGTHLSSKKIKNLKLFRQSFFNKKDKIDKWLFFKYLVKNVAHV